MPPVHPGVRHHAHRYLFVDRSWAIAGGIPISSQRADKIDLTPADRELGSVAEFGCCVYEV